MPGQLTDLGRPLEPAVIELGVLPGHRPDGDDPADDAGPRTRVGPGVIAAVIAVIMVLLGGSASTGEPRPPKPITLQTGTPVWFVIDGSTIYAAQGSDGLTAYDLPTLTPRWTSSLVVTSAMRVSAPGVQATDAEIVAFAPLSPRGEIVGVEAATGNERWRSQGYPLWRSPDGSRIVVAASGYGETGREPRRLIGFEASTGVEMWTHTIASMRGEDLAVVYGQKDGDPLVGALISGVDREVRLVDFETGYARPLPGLPAANTVRLADDLILLVPAGSLESVVAFDRVTLRPRWMVEGVVMRTSAQCGPLLCLHSANGTVAVEAATGAVRWRSDWTSVEGSGDRLIASRNRSSGYGDSAVLSATTGRTLLDLPEWRVLATGGGRYVPVVHRDLNAGIAHLGVVDTTSLTVRELGELPSDGLSCQASAVIIGCVIGPGEMSVWRYA